MNRSCIVVADANRARLHTTEELAAPPGCPSQELHEAIDLVHPARRIRPCELFSDIRPRSDGAPGGRGFKPCDRRDASMRQMDRRFAAAIAAELERLVAESGCRTVIVAASPHLLGLLRELTRGLIRGGVEVHEIDRELACLSSSALHDFLAERGLLPARERLARV